MTWHHVMTLNNMRTKASLSGQTRASAGALLSITCVERESIDPRLCLPARTTLYENLVYAAPHQIEHPYLFS